MLSPEAFETAYPPDDLAAELPESPVASLRDLQYLYGTLYTLATAGGGEYAPYLTPDAARDLVDTDDSLIVVRVDLSGDEPRLADDGRGPVQVTRYTDEHVEKVAHCKYPAARGIDHSVTHQAGRNSDPEKLARYANERLSKWASDDTVQAVADDHEGGWIVDALCELGEDDAARETIAEAVERELGGESTTALLTVQVRLDADGDYLWPGDLDVFMAAMRRRKLSKLVSKGEASDSSGTAVDLVTGERTRTVGTSEDPQNYYLGKQLETFPGLDVDEAWRTHPVSEDAAVTLMNAETFVEACTYRTFGAKVYSLPYFFGTPTPEETYELYGLLYEAATEDDGATVTPVERAYERHGDGETARDLRFHVSAVMAHQMSRYDVFGETLNGRIQYPAELARSHANVLRTSAFRGDGDRSGAMPTHEDRLLVSEAAFLGPVASGAYFAETFPYGDDDTDASADDARIEALVDVLSGTPIPVSLLLDAYVDRIVDDESADWFPSFRVASQFAQLCALASADGRFLDADDDHELLTRPPTYDTRTMTPRDALAITDGGFAGDRKLESFIENTPALQHDQRCGVFLLGALVGAVGNYQEWHEDRSTTLVDQFPVKSITTSRVKKVAQDAIEKTLTYTRQEKKAGSAYSGTKFDYIVDRLRERILHPDPGEWDLEKNDLRFYYALGITYGMNDYSPASDDETTADEDTQDD